MPHKIKNIVANYDILSGEDKNYYEQELFTKFEDAFIYEIGKGKTGLKIIHGKRSIVAFPTVADKGCELADLRCLFYSTKQKKCRLLFLQFKKATYDSAKPFVVEISDKQYELYDTHPDVFSKSRKISIPKDVLKDNLYKCDDAGTMFALIKEDKHGGYPLIFSNANKLNPVGTRKYECMGGTSVIMNGVPGFSYCEYAPSFQDFLELVKDMKVGREIPLYSLPMVLGTMLSEVPEDLKKLILSEGNLDENQEDGNDQQACCYVNTMFLNVDELE